MGKFERYDPIRRLVNEITPPSQKQPGWTEV